MNQDEIREAVFNKRPYLRPVYKNFGDFSLLQYAKENLLATNTLATQKEFEEPRRFICQATSHLVQPILGEEVAQYVEGYLSKHGYVSTVDHHGPMSDPSFVQGNIVQAEANKEIGEPVTLVFSAGAISLDNDSYPRGFTFHDETGNLIRLPILSLHERHKSIFALDAYSKAHIEKWNEKMSLSCPDIPFREMTENTKVLSLSKYWQQMTYMNYHLFRCLPEFNDLHFVILPIELLANELLLRHHMNTETEIGKILFDPIWRESYLRETDGIPVAYTKATQKGTELFWHLKDGRREQLFCKDGKLVNEIHNFSLDLEPGAIQEALKAGSIFPSFALCLVLVSFWGGYACGGGDSQVNYLAELKDAYIRMLTSLSETTLKQKIENLAPDRWGGDYFLFYKARSSLPFKLTYVDILRETEEFRKWMFDRMGDTTLAGAIDHVLLDTYHTIFGERHHFPPDTKNVFKN